jgi:hypothetical protein
LIRDEIFSLKSKAKSGQSVQQELSQDEVKIKAKNAIENDTIEVDEGLIGKMVEKVVYEKSKHIFPFRNWRQVRLLSLIRIYSLIQHLTTQGIQFWICDICN